MKTTDCLGLPYSECSPPLVKDQSDIEQFRDLAIATDTAVQALDDRITDLLVSPPAVSMQGSDNSAGLQVDHFYGGSVLFDTDNMGDTVSDVMRVQRTGWYMIGTSVLASPPAPGILFLRTETLVNGDPLSTQCNAFDGSVNGDKAAAVEVAFLNAGDAVTLRTRRTGNPADVVVYNFTGWMLGVHFDV